MSSTINKEIIRKYDVPGPRYTSYPTAPQWTNQVNETMYINKLKDLGLTDKTASLYVHIPFCRSLCSFCACNVIIRREDEKFGDEYLRYLFKEIDLIRASIGKKMKIKQLHFGGGTPTFLNETQLINLTQKLKDAFEIGLNGEIAIEIDPRTISLQKLTVLRDLGFNRVSLGVQDFNFEVQKEINRIQSFELVEQVTKNVRDLGFHSLNFDLIYGLPRQTKDSFHDTIQKVIGLKPDRIALYSFAYVPWLKKHQNKFNNNLLPVNDHKLDIFLHSRNSLLQSGYKAIAMDHFALEDDELHRAYERNELYRNFMGYTVKPADEYIGIGLTSIGFLEKIFIQNTKILPQYYEALEQGRLPVDRGCVLNTDDIIRQYVINSLMCHFHLNKRGVESKFQIDFNAYFSKEKEHLEYCIDEGLLEKQTDSFYVTELGKLFIRNICMGFDYYLDQQKLNHRFSRTV